MLKLEDLKPKPGSSKPRKRVGRGNASHGTYSGRGGKGQSARAGFRIPPGFEGGQTPLWKRVPKSGFTNFSRRDYAFVNVDVLAQRFDDGAEITPELLLERGVISAIQSGVKILGRGEIGKKLVVRAHRFSRSAVEKIEGAGGQAIALEPVSTQDAKSSRDSGSE